MRIPTFEEAAARVGEGGGTPLDAFVWANEPAAPLDGKFRAGLAAALAWAEARTAMPYLEAAAMTALGVPGADRFRERRLLEAGPDPFPRIARMAESDPDGAACLLNQFMAARSAVEREEKRKGIL